MPNSLQYPLERKRDLERRWNRLLRQTLPPRTAHRRAASPPRDHWQARTFRVLFDSDTPYNSFPKGRNPQTVKSTRSFPPRVFPSCD